MGLLNHLRTPTYARAEVKRAVIRDRFIRAAFSNSHLRQSTSAGAAPIWTDVPIRISSSGTALPKTRLTNESLAAELGVTSEWIYARCGVRNRVTSSVEETTISLGTRAARNTMVSCHSTPDLLICCTCTPAYLYCPIAPSIGAQLGIPNIGAFDLNAACTGGLVGMITAMSYLMSGFANTILLVCVDTMTKHLSPEDQNTRILFGDGAAALILERGDHALGSKVLSFIMGSDGRGAKFFGAESRLPDATVEGMPPVQMDGKALFRFAVEQGETLLNQLCSSAGIPPQHVDRVVIHQSNARITRCLQQRIPIPEDRWVLTLEQNGNLTSVSVILSLIESLERNDLREGGYLMIAAFGAGLTWAGLLLACHRA